MVNEMIRISQIKVNSADAESIERALCKKLNIRREDLLSWKLHRKSTDARGGRVLFSCIVDAAVKNEKKHLNKKDVVKTPDETYKFKPDGICDLKDRPVVAGFGPAGMAAALLLAEYGYKPIILERGSQIDQRQKDVDHFWKTGQLNPENNVQFGEGGAGAFSDGKLTTRSKDYRTRLVLEQLVKYGGQPDILTDAYPHIGTDVFAGIIKRVRQRIEKLGGTFRFHTRLEHIALQDGRLNAITVTDTRHNTSQTIQCQALILALGHSAGDTIRQLYTDGLTMENKPFQAGVRIEHPQTFINRAMLHDLAENPELIPARYALTAMADNGKGIYTFCMCPGGFVVNSSCMPGQLVVNGMSYAARDGQNANSALLVQINESDYGTRLFAGLDMQEELEKRAFEMGGDGFAAPVQSARDYLEGKVSESLPVKPTIAPSIALADLNQLFSKPVNDALHQGLQQFEKKVPGFLDGTLTGVESRASSAIRILRSKETFQSLSAAGIYPAGEGSGYAGGIMTSAIDGIKCAEALMDHFDRPERDRYDKAERGQQDAL